MTPLLWAIISTILVSLISLSGAVFIGIKPERMKRVIFILVALSAGTLMGGAFLHLLPESEEKLGIERASLWLICGFALFFLLERIIRWRHCHESGECHVHPLGYLSLLGDAVHNFFDGVIISGSFLISTEMGIVTSIVIISHEIPQELGDFGVLIFSGMKVKRALWLNFVTAITAIIGAFAGNLAFSQVSTALPYLMAISAGNFVYISSSDLIPELHKEIDLKRSLAAFGIFLAAVFMMMMLKEMHVA